MTRKEVENFFVTDWQKSSNGNYYKIINGVNFTIVRYSGGFSVYSDVGKANNISSLHEAKATVFYFAFGIYPEDVETEKDYIKDDSILASPNFKEILRQGYKALAKKIHPDAGGSTEKMQQLNELYEVLKQRFEL